MSCLRQSITRFIHDEDGPTATEYAVMLAVISMTVMVAMAAFGQGMNSIYVAIQNAVSAI